MQGKRPKVKGSRRLADAGRMQPKPNSPTTMSYTVMELLSFFSAVFYVSPRAHGPRAVPVSHHKEGWHLSPLFIVNGSEAGNDPRFPSDKYIIPCHMF